MDTLYYVLTWIWALIVLAWLWQPIVVCIIGIWIAFALLCWLDAKWDALPDWGRRVIIVAVVGAEMVWAITEVTQGILLFT